MAGCPLNDAELEALLEKVAARLQEGEAKETIVAEIADERWPEAEVAVFVSEVEARTRELGRPPRGCLLLRGSARTQARAGILFAIAGAIAASLAIPLERAWAVLAVSSALFLYGAAVFVCARRRLKRYRD